MYALITGAAYVVSGASDLALIIGGDCNSRVAQPQRHQDLSALRRRRRRRAADARPARPGHAQLQPRRRRRRRRPAEPAGLRQPHAADARAAGQGPALHAHGRPGRLPLGRRHPVRHHPGRAQRTPASSPTTSISTFPTRPTSASSTPPSTCCTSRAARSTTTSIATATPRPARCRWPWTRRSAEGRVKPGDLVVLSGFGAGLAWGTAVMRW